MERARLAMESSKHRLAQEWQSAATDIMKVTPGSHVHNHGEARLLATALLKPGRLSISAFANQRWVRCTALSLTPMLSGGDGE